MFIIMTTIKQINYRKISRYSLLQLLTFTVKTFILYIFLSREVMFTCCFLSFLVHIAFHRNQILV